MCIIIDTNLGHEYLEVGKYLFVREWVMKRGRLIMCDALIDEYGEHGSKMRQHVMFLSKSMKARVLSDDEMHQGKERLNNILKSNKIKIQSVNDEHILYMMAFSKCKLIFSKDNALIHDFKKIFSGRAVPLSNRGKKFLAQKSCP